MDKKKELKLSKHTVMWLFVICVLILLISVLAAENISPKYNDTYSIESSKLHMYN
ncbi:MAG: hypothetical protein K1W24_07425 [Lachnospiraceae bacterium]